MPSAVDPSAESAAVASTAIPAQAGTARVRRVGEAVALVGVWMALGYALHADGTGYLLLGVPLTAAFQIFVRRQPLTALWVWGPAVTPGRSWRGLGVLLAIVPGMDLVQSLIRLKALSVGWQLCDVIGASAPRMRWSESRDRHGKTCATASPSWGRLPPASSWPRPSLRNWGLWHLPIVPVPPDRFWVMVAGLIVTHSVIGIPLSLFWRRSQNLAVPAFAHAFADAVRNGFGFGLGS